MSHRKGWAVTLRRRERKGEQLCGHYSVFPRWPSHRLRQLASGSRHSQREQRGFAGEANRERRSRLQLAVPGSQQPGLRTRIHRTRTRSSRVPELKKGTTKTDPRRLTSGGLNSAWMLPGLSIRWFRRRRFAHGYPSSVRNVGTGL